MEAVARSRNRDPGRRAVNCLYYVAVVPVVLDLSIGEANRSICSNCRKVGKKTYTRDERSTIRRSPVLPVEGERPGQRDRRKRLAKMAGQNTIRDCEVHSVANSNKDSCGDDNVARRRALRHGD